MNTEELDHYLSKPVDLKDLIKQIDFTDEAVEQAALDQPKLFKRASRYHVQVMRHRVEASLAYEMEVARLSSRYQQRKDEKGKRTLTEGAVKAKVQLDHRIQKLRKRMELSLVYEKFAALLIETLRKREFAIKVIKDAQFAEGAKAILLMKEEGAKKMSRKLQKEVREKYRGLRSSGGSSGDLD